ncbi:MAG: cysteine synthase A [Clostridia bacterium]|nr:cysteine synthase A [Clostridia bacterium]
MKIYSDITALVGGTPLFTPKNLQFKYNSKANIFLKLEYLNPAGSIKDRAALSMILDAEGKGLLKKGATIIEPTSGNTGIGLAAIAASRGYKVILTMPETMSEERRSLLAAYGSEIVLTKGSDGMAGAVKKAKELAEGIDNSFIAGQFENPANAKAHFDTTGPEIYRDLDGKVDMVIAGIGTGGTITGLGKYFKSIDTDTEIIGIEPSSSPLISKGTAGPHGLQGIGANFIPSLVDTSVIDKIMTVSDDEAYKSARELAREEGILVGITSGAALHIALKLSAMPENNGKNIVAILPDTGDRYLSTPLFK